MVSTERSLQDRILRRAVPSPVEAYRPPPEALLDGLWTLDRQLVHFGLARLPARTVLVRLRDGSVAVISPPPLVDAATGRAIDDIGPVRYGVVPNTFHYLSASELMDRYPEASLVGAPGLAARVPELVVDIELPADPPEGWAGVLDHAVLGPVRGLSEVLFFHVPSGTLILTDLAFNMVRYPRPLDRLVWRLSGVPRGLGPGRTSRSFLLRDRTVAARALRRAVRWPIERIVVAHGEVVEEDAPARFRRAFADYLDRDVEPSTAAEA